MSNHPTIDYPAPPAVPPQGKLPMGSDGHAYDSDVSSIAGYSGTSNLLKLNTGESQTGAVVFQVPNGVKATTVKWTPDSGMADSTATWNVAG